MRGLVGEFPAESNNGRSGTTFPLDLLLPTFPSLQRCCCCFFRGRTMCVSIHDRNLIPNIRKSLFYSIISPSEFKLKIDIHILGLVTYCSFWNTCRSHSDKRIHCCHCIDRSSILIHIYQRCHTGVDIVTWNTKLPGINYSIIYPKMLTLRPKYINWD